MGSNVILKSMANSSLLIISIDLSALSIDLRKFLNKGKSKGSTTPS